jgi:hypothetical protein
MGKFVTEKLSIQYSVHAEEVLDVFGGEKMINNYDFFKFLLVVQV